MRANLGRKHAAHLTHGLFGRTGMRLVEAPTHLGWGIVADRRGFRLVYLAALPLWIFSALLLMRTASFGSSLNLNLHLDALLLDGVFAYTGGRPVRLRFLQPPPPEADDVMRVLSSAARRIHRLPPVHPAIRRWP